ncbi:MAG TPA: hypothetical protein VJK51_04220 [Candidatus Nanoarchaeia archaeon]|nr:hypothetical protein [Candidatus Nanoarchaeia archaeon]
MVQRFYLSDGDVSSRPVNKQLTKLKKRVFKRRLLEDLFASAIYPSLESLLYLLKNAE